MQRHLKEELAMVTDKWLWVISNMMSKTVTLRNYSVLNTKNIVCVVMWSLVTYSNYFAVYSSLMSPT